jgi:p-cumate 2,3-dioxygenase alpha subunit
MATNGHNGYAHRPELVIDDEQQGLFRVHRSVFTDPDILALERERIFDRCWIYAGHESEVRKPGDFVTRRVAGRPVIISRGNDDKVRVLLNSCTHRGAIVCRELSGNAKVHQCFYHGWTYTPEGAINGLPGADAYSDAFDRNERRLQEPPGGVSSYRDLIFVNFNPVNDVSLEDYLADAKDYIDVMADQSEGHMEVISGTQSYSMKGNYKLLVENSIDGYHAATTHKRYFDWLASANALDKDVMGSMLNDTDQRARLTPKVLGNGHAIVGRAVAPWGRPMAQWIPYFGEDRKPRFDEMYAKAVERLGEERAYEVCMTGGNLHIFPNLIINDIMSTTIRTFYPVEPGYMEITAWCVGPEEEQPAERALRLDNFITFLGPGGFATPDDVEALEACQRGFETVKEVQYSDISRGMKRDPHGDDELQMRAFWRQWARLMNASEPASIAGVPAGVGV